MYNQLIQEPAKFAPNYTNAYTGFATGLGGLGGALASGYGTIGNANSAAEAARQATIGNIASSMLGNYGAASGSAFGAWQANQTAYQKALSDMYGANQNAMSQLGQSRNNALGGLANAFTSAGTGLGAAAAVGDLNMDMYSGGGGGGGTISGNDGSLFSGSYGDGGDGSSMSLSVNKSNSNSMVPGIADQTFRGLNSTGSSLNDMSYLNALRQDGQSGLGRLDAQHYSSRDTPFQMLGSIGNSMSEMGRMGYGESRDASNQYYRNQRGVLGGLYDQGQALSGAMQGGYEDVTNSLDDLFRGSLGRSRYFQSPLERLMEQEEAEDYRRGMSRRYLERRKAEMGY